MKLVTFLNKRETGIRIPTHTLNGGPDSGLNLDSVVSRLVCWKKDCHIVLGHESEVPPFACKFNKDKNSTDLLAIANEDGDILLYDTFKEGDQALLKSFRAHHNAIFEICWLPGKPQLITVSGDHFAALWNVETSQSLSTFQKHVGSVKSVDVCPTDSAVFSTGSRDGSINIWDTRINTKNSYGNCYKSAMSIHDAHSRKDKWQDLPYVRRRIPAITKMMFCSVTAVAFQDCHSLASAGVADGVVKIWDLRKTYSIKNRRFPIPKHELSYCKQRNPAHGCTSLVFDSNYRNLYACCTSSVIYQFDCHSHECVPKSSYSGFRGATYFIKLALSCDDRYLLCGSSDEKAYIWKVSTPGLPILQLPGHTAEVTSVAWNQNDVSKLVTCGDDNQIHIWKSFGDVDGVRKNEILETCSKYIQGNDVFPVTLDDKASPVIKIDDTVCETDKTDRAIGSRTSSPVAGGRSHTTSIARFFSSPPSTSGCQDCSQEGSVITLAKSWSKGGPPEKATSPVLSPCKVLNVDNSPPSLSAVRLLGLRQRCKENAGRKRVRCRKSAGSSTKRCKEAKKQHQSTKGTLMNYFCVEPSPAKQ